LEEVVGDYTHYTAKYMMEKNNRQVQRLAIKEEAEAELKEQLAIKEEAEVELKEQLEYEKERAEQAEQEAEYEKEQRLKSEKKSKEKLERALKFNQATKQIEPQEYIYVVTTDNYSPENKFKPGGCETFKLLKSRLNTYNSGKSDSDSHYYVYVRKVVSYRSIEQVLLGCLGGFRENINKELYIIHFDWLVRCLDAIIDHTSEFLTFVNLNRDQMVEDTMNKEPVTPIPIRLEKLKISYQRVGEEEVNLVMIFDQDTIDAVKESLVSFNPDDNIIKRTTFENHLKQHYPEVKINNKKRSLWEIVKQIGGSVNPSWRFKY
jgi:actin-related protein